MSDRKLKIGLVLNPLAGIGGPVALKGSDGDETVAKAMSLGATSRVAERVEAVLREIGSMSEKFELITVAGEMGEGVCRDAGITCELVVNPSSQNTTAADTRAAVKAFEAAGVDVILFAGGDGTARDVFDAIGKVGNDGKDQVVLGIPCGVKMHSGVFANNPAAAAKILAEMIGGRLVTVMQGEVRDIDEASFRGNVVKTRYYGEMWVPEELRYLQQVKSGGKEVEALAVQEIAAHIVEAMVPGTTYFIGSGSTTAAINESLGLEGTLLGIDIIRDQSLLKADATEAELLALAEAGKCHIVVTAIGGQGHFFGRGNQQLSARVIKAVGLDNITIVATKSKLEALGGKPLLVDTGDAEVDHALAGMRRVVTGYEDSVLYQVSS